MRARPSARARAAILLGTGASFVAGVWLARAIRPALLLDPDPSWSPARLVLSLAVVAGAAGAAALVSGVILWWSGSRGFEDSIEPLPFSRRTLALLGVGAVLFGAAVRLLGIETMPWPLWIDDLSLLGPTQALAGRWRDFSDPVRAAPYGVPHPFGTVGVAYLELWRLGLRLWGVTVFGVRFPSLAGGVLSLVTAPLLARRLVPRGGAMTTALVLAGLRWSLILSRWGWQAVVLAPILDVSTIALLRARRRGSLALAVFSGLVAGLGAHVYLAAWIGASALLLFALWPTQGKPAGAARIRLGAAFALGFVLLAFPLVLAGREGPLPYFLRVGDHNVAIEARRAGSAWPVFAIAADALALPWFAADPSARQDIPGRARLSWVLAVPLTAVFARAWIFPRDELSAWLLAHAAAAFAAAVAAGQATHPNGYRYAYLTTVTAVAVSAGVLWLLGFTARARRRPWAIASVGLLAVGSLAGAQEALQCWVDRRETFDAFYGEDTLSGRAAARWERFGSVAVAPGLGFDPRSFSSITIDVVRRERLDADARDRERRFGDPASSERAFRVVAPDSPPLGGERAVERVRDGWGRERAVVYGRKEIG
jgi:hypothetical protein